nr:rRNA adenine N-6-methyltransferase family protein [Alsobacter ponti]
MALRAKGLRDTAILRAFETVSRSVFVPRRFIDLALIDVALPIACGQSTLAPSTMAEMYAALDLKPEHRVLEVGTGSGYGSAVLARLAREVVSIERYRSLATEAAARLQAQVVVNVTVRHGDGGEGAADLGPFDRILIEASVESTPRPLVAQLAPGGKILVIERGAGGSFLTRFNRSPGGALEREHLVPFSLPPLMHGTAAAL